MERSLVLLAVWALTSILAPLLVAAEECPERILGNERKRNCPRNCKKDKDCGAKRQCLCDGQCGLSCVVPSRTCPWPLPPGNNSEAHLLSPTPSFSALLEVRCLAGYAMDNGLDAAIRRCQGDRQWSGDEPVCTAMASPPPLEVEEEHEEPVASCELPEPDVSLVIVAGKPTVGATISYSCPTGYVLVGNSENVCHSNQTWHFPHPICQRMFCSPPAEVENGYLVAVQRKEYDVDDTIYYLCKKTYALDGPNKVTCLSNGSWSAIPFCRARCPIPAERSRIIIDGPKRWPFDVTDGVVQHGDNVTFFCKHPRKQCSYTAMETCFDGQLQAPSCYIEPTWLQYKLFPHRLVSEIDSCSPDDLVDL
ncbi:beta-2-glycoprotein 1-like [Engraulis encrasicolus]|uniref:beta-2-glycoprotein 1-like n=1 Tax=Engraulis encrasicolus TaxID=184585 RepID=UPI002FD15486